jgi:hypothetical protein
MHRLSTPAARGVALLLLTLLFTALLDADGLRKQAESQPQGVQHRLAIGVTHPLDRVSHALRPSTPRHELQVAIGRQDEDRLSAAYAF